MPRVYYVDTCVWMNILKEEEGYGNEPLWKIAVDFLLKALSQEDCRIAYSGIVLRELEHKIPERKAYLDFLNYLRGDSAFLFVKITDEAYSFARLLERKMGSRLSFYDYLHISVCKLEGMTLVTRDMEMAKAAREYTDVILPEDLA
jgi:predicted nucleic acid-binding protein